MALDPYSKANAESTERFEMGAIGNMDGECTSLQLTGGLDRIRAYDGALPGVRNIRFYRGNLAKTYGKIQDQFTQWLFTEENPLVGIYGRQNENGIEQLGFITLDTVCQATPVEVVKEEEVVDGTEKEELGEPVSNEE